MTGQPCPRDWIHDAHVWQPPDVWDPVQCPGVPLEERWRERAEKAEARVAELEDGLEDGPCGVANTEGDTCKLRHGHDVHQDGVGDAWGVRWGYDGRERWKAQLEAIRRGFAELCATPAATVTDPDFGQAVRVVDVAKLLE